MNKKETRSAAKRNKGKDATVSWAGMTQGDFLAVAEILTKKMTDKATRVECLLEIAKGYLKLGRKDESERIFWGAWRLSSSNRFARFMCEIDSGDLGIKIKAQERQKKRLRLPRVVREKGASFIFRNRAIQALGQQDFFSILRLLNEHARDVDVVLPLVFDVIRRGEPCLKRYLTLITPWDDEYNCVLDDLVGYYADRGDWSKALKYLQMITKRDKRLWCLALCLTRWNPRKLNARFGVMWAYVSATGDQRERNRKHRGEK